jgi:mono/diheme cytochrome c family protein
MRALLAAFLVLLIIVVLWIISGTYNVAAVEPHSDVMNWLLATVRDRSVVNHSQEIHPPSLQDPALVQAGLQGYHAMCFTCHAAPGHEASEIGQGLNPKPPKLEARRTQARSDAELYWIIKNGLRMTGMPAFGPTHDEKTLWSLVAFLRQLPKTDQQEYSAMVEAAGLREKADEHSHRMHTLEAES